MYVYIYMYIYIYIYICIQRHYTISLIVELVTLCYHTRIHAYLHTCIQAYMHTCIHAHIPTYLPTYLHTYIPAYIPTYLHTYIPTYSTRWPEWTDLAQLPRDVHLFAQDLRTTHYFIYIHVYFPLSI